MNPLTMRVAIAGGVFILGLIVGSVIQQWRLSANHAAALVECNDRYHQLELNNEKQNSGISLMNYRLEVAEDNRKKAEATAVYVRNKYNLQSKKVSEIAATTCSAMVESLKGVK